jgi:AcrR family transcriptional regulator
VFDVNSSRSYDSPLRDRAALQTRRAILAAAAQLFVEQGYVATTVDQIAQRAGVARPTVFAAAGNKRSLLKTIRDQALAGDDEPTPVAERAWYRETLNEPDARQSLRLHARNLVRISDRYADIEAVLQAAAAADAELAQLWRTNEDERRRGAEFIVEALLGKSPLRAGLTRDEAVDLLWSFAASSHYRRLVRDRGWPIGRYERWLTDTLCAQLLPPD